MIVNRRVLIACITAIGLTAGFASGANAAYAAAGGDDDLRWGARVFSRSADGRWSGDVPVPLAPGAPPAAAGPAALDMAGLMRIMAPPARAVALSPDGGTLAVWGDGAEAGLVRVLRRAPDGAWTHETALPAREGPGSGALRLDISNPFDLEGTLQLEFDLGTSTIQKSFVLAPGESSASMEFTGDELQDLLEAGTVAVTASGTLGADGGTITVQPDDTMTMSSRLELVILVGGSNGEDE